jgi:chromate transporter
MGSRYRPAVPTSDPAPARRARLAEVAWAFLRLGTLAFGGPAAHLALMEDEFVRKRRWITPQRFVDLLGATNLIPGPNSTEMAIHIGHARAGRAGLVVAGACFILPATLIVSALAWAYVRFGALPGTGAFLRGMQPVVIAVVLQALVRLAPTALSGARRGTLGALAALACILGAHELVVLAQAAAAGVLWALVRAPRTPAPPTVLLAGLPVRPHAAALAGGAAALAAPAAFTLGGLFLVFLKIGSVLFGSGYVLLVFLRADLVERLGWLGEHQLLDAVAIGQVTPGPLFTTATFIGWLLAGPRGAAVATAGIFLPAFVFVALTAPLLPLLRRSRVAAAALDGVNAGSFALMAVVLSQLGRTALADPLAWGIGIASAIALLRFRLNAAWLVLAGGCAGWLASRV